MYHDREVGCYGGGDACDVIVKVLVLSYNLKFDFYKK